MGGAAPSAAVEVFALYVHNPASYASLRPVLTHAVDTIAMADGGVPVVLHCYDARQLVNTTQVQVREAPP